MILVAFQRLQKLSHYLLSTKDGEKTTLTRFYVDKLKLGLESARATLCKLATCARQTFLLAEQAETVTN